MAALPDYPVTELVELPSLKVSELDPLLNEEIKIWQRRFAWDFRPSAELLRRFVQIQSLSGQALRAGQETIGYSYHVCEGRKGLIGDFFVREDYLSGSNEMLLLDGVVRSLMLTQGIRRIESQLMLLHAPENQQLPFSNYLHRHDRYFLQIDCERAMRLSAKVPAGRFQILPWMERYQEEIAHVVAAAYKGHVDSEINDQYRSIPGARHFLMNIVKFPGCGKFSPTTSLVAVDQNSGRICGVCLASLVSAESGHITQLCIIPAIRQSGLGYELLRQTMGRLAQSGCKTVSLTVTCSNVNAIRLYESVGFEVKATFPALVWEGF